MAHSRVTLRAARWSATHPWKALLVWLLFVASAVGAGVVLSTQETTDADYRLGQSGEADEIITDAGLDQPDSEDVVITAPDGQTLDRGEAEDAATEVRAAAEPLDELVDNIGPPVWSESSDALLVSLHLTDTDDEPDVSELQDVVQDVAAAHPGLRVQQAGGASIDAAINGVIADDLAAAERISLPLTLIIMLVAFGALIAAGIPVLLAISSVLATIGIYAPISFLVPSEPTVSSMIVLIGMAVGVDYSLFYLKREREERAKGRSTVDAVEIAAATSGHAIIVSGLAVIVSMAGLYVVGDATFSSLATGAILVVAIAVLGSITVLPALLSTLGRWVDRPRVPLLWRLNRRIGQGGISRRLLGPVLRRPVVSVVVAGGALLALGAPALGMEMREGSLATLPQDLPEVQAAQTLERAFPSEGSTVEIAVQAAEPEQLRVQDALAAMAEDAFSTGDFVATRDGGEPDIRTSDDGMVSVLTLATPYESATDDAARAVTELRDDLAPRALDPVSGADWAVGGDLAEELDFTEHQRSSLPWVIAFVLLLTLVMIGWTFRSAVIAGITTLLNLASVAAAFGVLTLVFQHEWAEGLLDFESSGYVINWIPLFLFVVLVGLSMDYHVFVLSRIREGMLRGLPPRVAVENGVTETAGVVTSAAAVMVSIFAIFAGLSMMEMKQMGVGLAVAVLIDATVVRIVILPAVLTMLGERAWWPSQPARPVLDPVDVGVGEPALVGSAR